MAFVIYLESNVHTQLPGVPILTEGYDSCGNKHWFYIGPSDWSFQGYKIPTIMYQGKSLFISKSSRESLEENQFTELHTKLKESTNLTYSPGTNVDIYDLVKIISESNLSSLINSSSNTIYTLYTDLGGSANYGWINIEPYYRQGSYKLVNLGKSSLYYDMDLYLISDDNIATMEWNIISGTLYEQIIRGLSSPGNWEELSNSEYGQLFKLRSGWGQPTLLINNDITKTISHTNLQRGNKAILTAQISKIPIDIARNIAPEALNKGLLNSALNRYIDWSRYDTLFANAGVKENNKK